VVLPEPPSARDLQGCTLVDGWCTDRPRCTWRVPTVAGETITLIEGSRTASRSSVRGGVRRAARQGGNQFTFWALSVGR
jgi:hypothetical protein